MYRSAFDYQQLSTGLETEPPPIPPALTQYELTSTEPLLKLKHSTETEFISASRSYCAQLRNTATLQYEKH